MTVEDPFSDYPELQIWRASLEAAKVNFDAETERADTLNADEGLACFCNAIIQFTFAIGDANEAVCEANEDIRLPFTRSYAETLLKARFPRLDLSFIEERVLTTRIAYVGGFRLEESGARDSRMQAAMALAACLEGLKSDDPVETVRKSIQRFRQKVRGTSLFRLDPETLMVERFDAEDVLLKGLPGKNGAPRKSPDPNRK